MICNSNYNHNNNNKAFSLIELSIVLIIMGLLVAGVMGGSSLIKSANLISTIAEIQNIKTSHLAYYNRHGRVAGGTKEKPTQIGTNNNGQYITWETSEKAPFFEELKEDDLIEKEVYKFGEVPYIYSKYNNTGYYGSKLSYSVENEERPNDEATNDYKLKYTGKNIMCLLETPENSTDRNRRKKSVSLYTAKLFDEKMDDGQPKNGSVYVRSYTLGGAGGGVIPDHYDNDKNSDSKSDKLIYLSFVLDNLND